MNKHNAIALLCVVSFPLMLIAASPIALNGGGGTPWSGGSFASASTISASGCNAYSFSSETTLGFGRSAADEFCIGTTTDSKYVTMKLNGSNQQLKFNIAGTAAVPQMVEYDNQTSGFSVSDGTSPFMWTSGGAAKTTLITSSGRTYLCAGAWNTNGVPCFTSNGSDFVMKDSDGSTFGGYLGLGSGSMYTGDGTAAAPAWVFDNGNTGFYKNGGDTLSVAIDGVYAGDIARPGLSLKPQVGYYIKLDAVNGDPPSGDCNATSEQGRITYDYANHQLEVCNEQSTTRAGWDTAALTD